MKIKIFAFVALNLFLISCAEPLIPIAENAIVPTVITEKTLNDTDDPAIWLHPTDKSKSLIIGTDKEVGGGLYVFDLEGKIVNKFLDMQRPNNVDVAYGLNINGKKVDVAITTERMANRIRVFSLPDLKPIDNGGIPVFVGETGEEYRDAMGIALYTKKLDSTSSTIYAIVGRKNGPSGTYLWQYELKGNQNGNVTAHVVRKFGEYSGEKEIEAIAVDNELGYVYYSDETVGVRKYYVDPAMNNNTQLAFFAQNDAKRDHEGISIYKTSDTEGYILVSNQQNNSFLVYPREGSSGNPHIHLLLADIPVSTIESDGSDAIKGNFGTTFPNGFLVAMSNGMVFHLYDWNLLQERIDEGIK